MPPRSESRMSPHRQRLPSSLEDESSAWLEALRSEGQTRAEAIVRLHELLLGAARFEVSRRRHTLPYLRGGDFDDIAHQSADDALVAVLAKLDDFRGESRFTTWAYKFALLEAAVKLRRRAWQSREVPIEPENWLCVGDGRPGPETNTERGELLDAVRRAIDNELTPHQREVLTALALNEVPIDVLSERLGTTRGALYKTLHDARQKLRHRLEADGFAIEAALEGAGR
jgi:RNA polymerase sigma-70 factor, ECF subfamily